jgi:hypothetical protein
MWKRRGGCNLHSEFGFLNESDERIPNKSNNSGLQQDVLRQIN